MKPGLKKHICLIKYGVIGNSIEKKGENETKIPLLQSIIISNISKDLEYILLADYNLRLAIRILAFKNALKMILKKAEKENYNYREF